MTREYKPVHTKAGAPPTPSFNPVRTGLLQRKCACGDTPELNGGCAECREKRQVIQRQASIAPAAPAGTPWLVQESLRSPGQPLDTGVRAEMEPRFGHDFGAIRVHADPRASASAREIGSRAYTVGHNIVFAAGQYAPQTAAGRHLLAHELAHVVQQARSPGSIQTAPNGIAPADGFHEQQAEAAADAVLSGGHPAALDPAGTAIQRAPETTTEAPSVALSAIGMSVSLSGITFDVPESVTYKPGRKTPQLLAIVLGRLLGPNYPPGLVAEVEAVLKKQGWERYGGFKEAKPAQGGEKIGQITLALGPALTLISFLKGKKLELQLTAEQEDLLMLGYVNRNLWADFLHGLKESDLTLPTWYTRDIFDREMAQHGLILRAYADQLAKAQGGDVTARTDILETLSQVMEAIYQPAMVLETIRLDISLAADEKTAGVYGDLWQLPPAKKGEAPKITTPPTKLRSVPAAVLLLGYMRTQPRLALNAETDAAARRELMTNYAGFTRRLLFEGEVKTGDEEIRDRPATANAPAFPSTLAPVAEPSPPPFEAALGTDFRFNMEVQFPSVYEALGRYAFNWERVRIPNEKIGEPIDPAKLEGEEVGLGEVAAVRFGRTTAYAREDIQRVVDSMQSDIGPAGVGALDLVGANAILRYIGTGIRLAVEILTMPANQKLITFPDAGLYFVRGAMSQVREGDEAVVRAPSVAYYPVLARDPDEMAAGGVKATLTRREKTEQRIKELERTLTKTDLSKEERDTAQQELDALRLSIAPLGQRLERRRAEAAKRVEAIKSGTEQGDVEEAKKEQENIEKIIALRAKRKVDNAELLTARFVSDLGQAIPLTLEVVDRPTRTTKQGKLYTVYISDVTTPKSGDETGTGRTRDDAIADGVRKLLEGIEGYGRGRVSLALEGGVRTLRIAASLGSLLSESIENVTTTLSVAAIAAAPLTGGASLAFLVPLGVVGAVPSAYRVAMRLESSTFELNLENGLEIVNIAGSLIGLGRVGATSLRMMRVSRGLLIIGFGVDAAGAIMMSAQFVQQIEAFSKIKDPGERAAALMLLIGQTLQSAGVMVGGTLAERAHQQHAEAKGGRLQRLIDETPPGADPTKPPAGDPAARQASASADAMFEKARVDSEMSRLGKMDAESEARLRKDESLRKALNDQPLAAAALKKCASPCFPPDITPQQVARLDRLLSRLAEAGGYDEAALKKYLYDRRGELDMAISRIESATSTATFNATLEFYNRGGEVKTLPPKGDPRLLIEQLDRAHDIGVKYGREQAKREGLDPVGFDNPIRQGRYGQGLDDVMKKGPNLDIGEVYVVEYKGGESRLAEGQMELDWIIGNIRRLYTEGGPDGQAWARILAKALREGRLRGVAYSTPLLGNAPQPTKTLKTWNYPARNLRLP